MSTKFYSNGKLLLSGEYLVLDGAMALSIPTKYGQSMTVEAAALGKIHWKSVDNNGMIWFEHTFNIHDIEGTKNFTKTPKSTTETLLKILQNAKKLNSNFLNKDCGWNITTNLNFPQNWGLGTSSTLINNIAQWAQVNAFKLLETSFGGSGYDIAAAKNNTAILYRRGGTAPVVTPVEINWNFTNQLFFIHLNQKQNSKEGIAQYRKVNVSLVERNKISAITNSLVACETLTAFEQLLEAHETLISGILKIPTAKALLFNDYPGAIKSLGAWGGDFIMVTASRKELDYFRNKGYQTIIPFAEMML